MSIETPSVPVERKWPENTAVSVTLSASKSGDYNEVFNINPDTKEYTDKQIKENIIRIVQTLFNKQKKQP